MTQVQSIIATIETMTSAFAAGNIDQILSTYAPEAVVMCEPGQEVTGRENLKAMFSQFIQSGVEFSYGPHEVIVAGETALHVMKWTAPDTNGVPSSALSIAVLRCQSDGHWKMVVDHPFGDHVLSKY